MKIKLAFSLLILFISSCGSDESPFKCSDCVNSPEANAANDGSGKGIYKGLVVGSTGTIRFDIANNSSSISALLVFDGEDYALHTEGTYDSESGFQGYFYGMMNSIDDIIIGIYVSTSGEFEIFQITIPGHENVSIEIFKELSTELVRVFEGTYRGDAVGTFNLVSRGDLWIVSAKSAGEQYASYFYGSLSNGSLTCIYCDEVVITGKINGDIISGEWSADGGDESGTWKGKRTL